MSETEMGWTCGCGWNNGINLAVCEALTDEVLDDAFSEALVMCSDTEPSTTLRHYILTALRPLLEQQAAEVTDWILVADGVKHDWRCKNNEASGGVKGGNFICLRCQVATLTAERDEARTVAVEIHAVNDCACDDGVPHKCLYGQNIAAWSGETQ